MKLYWGITLHGNSSDVPKRIIPGKIKYKYNKSAVVNFKELEGIDFEDVRQKLHNDIDLFFSEIEKAMQKKIEDTNKQNLRENIIPTVWEP